MSSDDKFAWADSVVPSLIWGFSADFHFLSYTKKISVCISIIISRKSTEIYHDWKKILSSNTLRNSKVQILLFRCHWNTISRSESRKSSNDRLISSSKWIFSVYLCHLIFSSITRTDLGSFYNHSSSSGISIMINLYDWVMSRQNTNLILNDCQIFFLSFFANQACIFEDSLSRWNFLLDSRKIIYIFYNFQLDSVVLQIFFFEISFVSFRNFVLIVVKIYRNRIIDQIDVDSSLSVDHYGWSSSICFELKSFIRHLEVESWVLYI